jgi:class 3 adenylate cyclase
LSGERVERRLAAILAADVVAYSRLMGHDEAGTLARLRGHRRELIDSEIAEHKGRIVKTTGDGILIEFPSVLGRRSVTRRSSKPIVRAAKGAFWSMPGCLAWAGSSCCSDRTGSPSCAPPQWVASFRRTRAIARRLGGLVAGPSHPCGHAARAAAISIGKRMIFCDRRDSGSLIWRRLILPSVIASAP